jgi:hypothetical protein
MRWQNSKLQHNGWLSGTEHHLLVWVSQYLHYHNYTQSPPWPCSPHMVHTHLTKQFSVGLGLHQLRHILRQGVIQLIFLIVGAVIHLLDLKYICRGFLWGEYSVFPLPPETRCWEGVSGKDFDKEACNLSNVLNEWIEDDKPKIRQLKGPFKFVSLQNSSLWLLHQLSFLALEDRKLFFLAVFEFELRASCMLSRHSNPWSTLPTPLAPFLWD